MVRSLRPCTCTTTIPAKFHLLIVVLVLLSWPPHRPGKSCHSECNRRSLFNILALITDGDHKGVQTLLATLASAVASSKQPNTSTPAPPQQLNEPRSEASNATRPLLHSGAHVFLPYKLKHFLNHLWSHFTLRHQQRSLALGPLLHIQKGQARRRVQPCRTADQHAAVLRC